MSGKWRKEGRWNKKRGKKMKRKNMIKLNGEKRVSKRNKKNRNRGDERLLEENC